METKESTENIADLRNKLRKVPVDENKGSTTATFRGKEVRQKLAKEVVVVSVQEFACDLVWSATICSTKVP
jgi:hypothetical protein